MMFETLAETYHDYNGRSYDGLPDNTLHVCDWHDLMRRLPNGSVDMILTDMPYGTTACSWDTVIDLAAWWAEVERVMKPRGAVVCTASQPFMTTLTHSNLQNYKYCWYWKKNNSTLFQQANRQPLRVIEEIPVFYSQCYYPQGLKALGKARTGRANAGGELLSCNTVAGDRGYIQQFTSYPTHILEFDNERRYKHPTQKPVALFEYLIRTYTQPGELVVDPFVGSGTTAVAAKITGRRFICGDQSAEYIDIARKRVFPTFGEPPKRKREELPITDLPLFAGLKTR